MDQRSDAEQDWQSLQSAAQAGTAGRDLTSGTAREAERARQLDVAEQALSFQTQYATHAKRGEAKAIEALALLKAASLGDRTFDARRSQLVGELRGEPALTSTMRCEIVARYKNLNVAQLPWTARAERVAGYTITARALIDEFPDVAVGYESLLSLAEEHPPAEGRAIAADILRMEEAPSQLKKAAWDFIARCDLIGSSAADIARGVEEGDLDMEDLRGKRLVVYSWSTRSQASLDLARKITGYVDPSLHPVGVNLDTDLEVAASTASSQMLPGRQIYGFSTAGSRARWALRLTEPGLVYATDDQGRIKSVTASRNLAEALSTGE